MISQRAELVPVEHAGTVVGHTDADRWLSEATRQRIIDSVPPTTRRAYARQWAEFGAWCAEHGRIALPARGRDPDRVRAAPRRRPAH